MHTFELTDSSIMIQKFHNIYPLGQSVFERIVFQELNKPYVDNKSTLNHRKDLGNNYFYVHAPCL